MMERPCSLETIVEEAADRRTIRDEELGEALRAAVAATQEKINRAFGDQMKVTARLKTR